MRKQGLLSLSGSGVPTQSPVAESHSTSLHSLSGESVQLLGSPMHSPSWQTPLIWQRSVGVQAVPSFTGAAVQDLSCSLQMTESQGERARPQSLVGPPIHAPASQVSPSVQNTPSSHGVPFGAATTTQVLTGPTTWPVLQTASVQAGVSSSAQSIPHGPRSSPP